MFLKVPFDYFSELGYQFQHTDLKKTIEKSWVSFEKGDDEILWDEVVEGFLLYGAVGYLLRLKLVSYLVWDLVSAAVEGDGDVEVVFEHIVGRVEVELDLIEFCDFWIEIAGKVKGSQFKGVVAVLLSIDNYF